MVVIAESINNMARKNNKLSDKNNLLSSQQVDFLNYYLDPKSETYGNAKRSALKAKYAEQYAENITNILPKWLSDNMESYGKRFDDNVLYKRHMGLINKNDKVVVRNLETGESEVMDTGEPDTQAVKAGLDMAYKIKNTYAPLKIHSLNVNINAEHKDEAKRAIQDA